MFSFVRSLSRSLFTPGSLHICRVHRLHAEQMEGVFTLEWFIGVLNMYTTNKPAWVIRETRPKNKNYSDLLQHHMQETKERETQSLIRHVHKKNKKKTGCLIWSCIAAASI